MNIRPTALANSNHQYKTKNDQTSFGYTIKNGEVLSKIEEMEFLKKIQNMIPNLTKSENSSESLMVFKDKTVGDDFKRVLYGDPSHHDFTLLEVDGGDEIHNLPSLWTTVSKRMNKEGRKLFDEINSKLTELSMGS